MNFEKGKSYATERSSYGRGIKLIKIENIENEHAFFDGGKSARIKNCFQSSNQFFIYHFSEKDRVKVFASSLQPSADKN